MRVLAGRGEEFIPVTSISRPDVLPVAQRHCLTERSEEPDLHSCIDREVNEAEAIADLKRPVHSDLSQITRQAHNMRVWHFNRETKTRPFGGIEIVGADRTFELLRENRSKGLNSHQTRRPICDNSVFSGETLDRLFKRGA